MQNDLKGSNRADGRKYAHFEGIFETLIYLIHANIDINKSF